MRNTRQSINAIIAATVITPLPPRICAVNSDVKKDFTGSVQDWYITVDDIETGSLKNIGFYFSHKKNNLKYTDFDKEYIKNEFYKQVFESPKIIFKDENEINLISGEFEINKDNKELIDMTFQIEPISIEKDVFFSQWMMKLSNLLGTYTKIDLDKEIVNPISNILRPVVMYTTVAYQTDATQLYFPLIILKINKQEYEKLLVDDIIKYNVSFPNSNFLRTTENMVAEYYLNFDKISEKTDDALKFNVTEKILYAENQNDWDNKDFQLEVNNREIFFKKTDIFCENNLAEIFDDESYYFVNADFWYDTNTNAIYLLDEFEQNLITIKGEKIASFPFYSN